MFVWDFLTIICGSCRVPSWTGICSFSIFSSICPWCYWHRLLTKSDLPQHLQELWLINAGGEPPGNISDCLPVWWLQRLQNKIKKTYKNSSLMENQLIRSAARHTYIFERQKDSCSYGHISQGNALSHQEGFQCQGLVKSLQETHQLCPGTLLLLTTYNKTEDRI